MAWDESGLWVCRRTEGQWLQGGVWIVGDVPYCTDPDYPGKNDGSVLVKLWVAHGDKYGGGYAPKERIAENRWEYVRVFGGCLVCEISDGSGNVVERRGLCCLDPGIDLPPHVLRSWRLPGDRSFETALGITICRRCEHFPLFAGEGRGYVVFVWDEEVFSLQPQRFSASECSPKAQTQLVVVLGGTLLYSSAQDPIQYALEEGDFTFLRSDAAVVWEPKRFSRGIVFYF